VTEIGIRYLHHGLRGRDAIRGAAFGRWGRKGHKTMPFWINQSQVRGYLSPQNSFSIKILYE